jgi:hemolysin activation/secretion protein
LFPIRGFDSNLLEASKAAAAGLEVFWPLANLQTGYKTFPVYIHRLRLGTFVDAGFAGESISGDDLLVGAGIELVTSMEIAWGHFSALRIGIAWPVVQPDYLDEDGPVFVFQLGRPL